MRRTAFNRQCGTVIADYVSNLKFWVDPDRDITMDASKQVSNAVDQSRSGNNATQGTATDAAIITLNVLNGRPSFRLDGVSDHLQFPALIASNDPTKPWTVFAVVSRGADTTTRIIDGDGISNEFALSLGTKEATALTYNSAASKCNVTAVNSQDTATVANGVAAIIAGRWDGTNVEFWINGVKKTTTAIGGTVAGANANARVNYIGRNRTNGTAGLWFNGDVGIVRVYAEVVPAAQMPVVFNKINEIGRYRINF